MIDQTAVLLAAAGLAAGALLGLAARLGRFCMMGAVEDAVYGGDLLRVRMVALAAAAAIAGTALLAAAGGFDPDLTRHRTAGWSPSAVVIGGLLFGHGMAMVGTCGMGALARLGGGDLRALVMALVIGIFALATQYGPLSGLRLWLAPPEVIEAGSPGLAELGAAATGLPAALLAVLAAAALAAFALADPRMRAPGGRLLWPLGVGGAIVLGWAATYRLSDGGFELVAVESLSFSLPLGEALRGAALGSGAALPDFGVSAALGVVLGALAGSALRREARWEACDDARELGRQLLGAASMGVGGVLAMGCTVGQGLTAMSVLAPSAPVAVVSILVGARLGLSQLVEGLAPGR